MPKESGDSNFLAQLRRERDQQSGKQQMHMTTPPQGPGRSLEELVASQKEEGVPVGQVPGPVDSSIGNIREIPVEKIKDSPYQIKVISEEDLDAMIESSRETKGFTSTIVVRPVDDYFELVVGHRRFKSAVRAGKKTITAIVRELADVDAARALAADNFVKHALSDFESYLQIQVFEKNGFANTNMEIARLLGRSRQDVIRYQSFGGLPQEALDFLDLHRDLIGGTAAKQLSAFVVDYGEKAGPVIVDCLKKFAEGGFKTQDAMVSAIESSLSGKEPKKKEKPAQFVVVDEQHTHLAKVVISASGVKISGDGLDMKMIEEMLKRELPKCKAAE